MTTDNPPANRTRLEATFNHDDQAYEAVGYGVIESGPGVDGRLLIEDISVRVVEPWLGMIYAAHDALTEEYWRGVAVERASREETT